MASTLRRKPLRSKFKIYIRSNRLISPLSPFSISFPSPSSLPCPLLVLRMRSAPLDCREKCLLRLAFCTVCFFFLRAQTQRRMRQRLTHDPKYYNAVQTIFIAFQNEENDEQLNKRTV